MSYNKVQVLKDNISAIRTAFALTDSNRTATEEELAILQKYSGYTVKSALSRNANIFEQVTES